MITENEWTVPRFWFEANDAWGWIETREDWNRIVAQHASHIDLMAAQRGPYKNGAPTYGLRSEHRGPGTLADHFAGQS